MKLKKLLAFGLALVMCLAMAACGTNPDENPEESTSQTDAEPVSITVTENWDFSVGFYPVITPMVSSTYGAGFWSRNFYNTLVSYDDNGKIQGELAETWEISDDGKTYTFHLRDGVKFSDGTPLTSEAVKMTLEAVVTNLGPQNGAFGKLTTLFDKLETPDEKTFVMTLKTPYYAALDNLTMALPLGIVNPAAFEGGVEKAYENCVSATMGTIDAVDMNTWYGDLMAGEYDLTFYNTAGGSFDPATDMSNMAPGAMGDPILCQFSAFFENPEIFAELDSTSDSQRVQEIYGMILNGIADQNLLVPVTGTHDLALWNTDKITGYDFYTDASYVDIASVHVK